MSFLFSKIPQVLDLKMKGEFVCHAILVGIMVLLGAVDLGVAVLAYFLDLLLGLQRDVDREQGAVDRALLLAVVLDLDPAVPPGQRAAGDVLPGGTNAVLPAVLPAVPPVIPFWL